MFVFSMPSETGAVFRKPVLAHCIPEAARKLDYVSAAEAVTEPTQESA